jgi:hypothetical protein
MRPSDTNSDAGEDAGTLALRALVWTLAEPERALRLLSVTGIEPAGLRARIGDPAVLAACLNFLLAHEADLIACADGLGVPPTALARAAETLETA